MGWGLNFKEAGSFMYSSVASMLSQIMMVNCRFQLFKSKNREIFHLTNWILHKNFIFNVEFSINCFVLFFEMTNCFGQFV